ncbi:hypothetical protein QF050_001742 [Arthrobacter sp. SLBN-112]|nr:hypothetical protein [Arthrobacter sp. SLBN-112]
MPNDRLAALELLVSPAAAFRWKAGTALGSTAMGVIHAFGEVDGHGTNFSSRGRAVARGHESLGTWAKALRVCFGIPFFPHSLFGLRRHSGRRHYAVRPLRGSHFPRSSSCAPARHRGHGLEPSSQSRTVLVSANLLSRSKTLFAYRNESNRSSGLLNRCTVLLSADFVLRIPWLAQTCWKPLSSLRITTGVLDGGGACLPQPHWSTRAKRVNHNSKACEEAGIP